MFLNLEILWFFSYFILAFARNNLNFKEFFISFSTAFFVFILTISSQGIFEAGNLGLKTLFLLINILFVKNNPKFAIILFLIFWTINIFSNTIYESKGLYYRPWFFLLIIFLINGHENLKFKKEYLLIYFLLIFLSFFTFSFRSQIYVLILFFIVYSLYNYKKNLVYVVPVITFFIFAFGGFQFFYYFSDNQEFITRSNIQRSFYNYFVLTDLTNNIFGKNIYIFSQEMWYLLPDYFYTSSYDPYEIDPHNIFSFFLLYMGLPGIIIFIFLVYRFNQYKSTNKNILVTSILISELIALLSLNPFSAVSRVSIAILVGLLHAMHDEKVDHDNNNLLQR